MDDMRRTITALVLLTASMGAHAQSPDEDCKAYQEAAESVMYARQYGRTPDEIYEMAADSGLDRESTLREMVSGAYEVPQSVYANGMRIAAEDYGDQWFARCMDAKGE